MSLELSRRDQVSLPLDSILVSVIKNIYTRAVGLAEGTPAVDSCAWPPRRNGSRFLPPAPLLPHSATSPKFSKIPSLPRPPCFLYGPAFYTVCTCANTFELSPSLFIFCQILLQVLGFSGTVLLHYFLFPVASQVYLGCY